MELDVLKSAVPTVLDQTTHVTMSLESVIVVILDGMETHVHHPVAVTVPDQIRLVIEIPEPVLGAVVLGTEHQTVCRVSRMCYKWDRDELICCLDDMVESARRIK